MTTKKRNNGGNLKMNGSVAEVNKLVELLNNIDVPANRVNQAVKKEIKVAAQNTYTK